MSASRADNAARDLLARLNDEVEVESAPLDEVRADLALLGIDAARAIRFSRRLAEEMGSPAAGLLAKSFAAEDDERELAALEKADIGAVRTELTDAAPIAAANAQRLASRIAQSARQRRGSRRMWYGIGGAITAIAASILIVVNLSNRTQPQQMAYAPESELTSTANGALEQPDASSKAAAPASSAPVAGAADTGTVPVSNAPAVSDGAATRFEQQYDRIAGTAATEEAMPDRLAIDIDQPSGATAGADSFRARQVIAESEFAAFTVSAALILQPELAPEPLRQSDLHEGNLTSRLPEVAKLPMKEYIIALVTLKQADGTAMDAMLFHMPVGHLQALRKSDAEAPLDENEPSALTEPIGAQPSLRQLLGKQGEDFLLVKLNPPAAAGQE
ncbi:MAG TPA: hypothetical protein VMT98_12585 [Verrucomicrobiae bacterium]|nr:hypothetical protein [Verrucomicrobiae bacterium]